MSKQLDRPRFLSVGIDQSYARTGVSIAADGKLVACSSIDFEGCSCKAEKRELLSERLDAYLKKIDSKIKPVDRAVVIERTRQFSDGFVSMPYIKSLGALNATISDAAYRNGWRCYSIDTRAWKHAVVGTSKPAPNKWGVNEKKWPTIMWMKQNHPEAFKKLLHEAPKRKKKGVIELKSGKRMLVDDDACDSACIALSIFVCDSTKFAIED